MSNKRLTNEERAEVFRLWKEEGLTYEAIAEQCDICVSTVGKVVKKMNAVQGMLDTLSREPAVIEQTAEPVIMTEEHTGNTVPDAVIEAVEQYVAHMENIVAGNLDEIRSLQQANEVYRTKIAAARTWLAEVDT